LPTDALYLIMTTMKQFQSVQAVTEAHFKHENSQYLIC